jgi:hypothetical protein
MYDGDRFGLYAYAAAGYHRIGVGDVTAQQRESAKKACLLAGRYGPRPTARQTGTILQVMGGADWRPR